MTIYRLDDRSDSGPDPGATSHQANANLRGLRVAQRLPKRGTGDRWFRRLSKRKRALKGAAMLRWMKLSYETSNVELAAKALTASADRQWIHVEKAFLVLAVVSAASTLVLVLGWTDHITQKLSAGAFTATCLTIAGGLQVRRRRPEER